VKLVSVVLLAVVSVAAFAQSSGSKPVNKAELDRLETIYTSTKKAYTVKGKASAPKVKSAYTDAAYAFGFGSMTSEDLPPRLKYTQALRLYREVLSVDPAHKKAKSQKELIESIYKQMGKPIPK